MTLRATILGIIILVVGFFVLLYGFSRPWDFMTPLVGLVIMFIGLWVLGTKFKQWVRSH